MPTLFASHDNDFGIKSDLFFLALLSKGKLGVVIFFSKVSLRQHSLYLKFKNNAYFILMDVNNLNRVPLINCR